MKRLGITVHPEAHRHDWPRQWLENELRPWFAGRILPVTEAISERWGTLEGDCQCGTTPNDCNVPKPLRDKRPVEKPIPEGRSKAGKSDDYRVR
jgi:hypothetical protein